MTARARTALAETGAVAVIGTAGLPLQLVGDVDLPGRPVRFDYQDLDQAKGHLIIAHMGDASVVVVNVSDGSIVKVVENVARPRGVAVADDVGRIFVTSSPATLLILDNRTFDEVARVGTGTAPDGVGYDPKHAVVGVSDQGDGAVSLIAGAGTGARRQIRLGRETGNVVFDSARDVFWVTVEPASPPDQLVSVDPVAATIVTRIALPGCTGAHGLRLAPDLETALIACEDNAKLVRVSIDQGSHALALADTGSNPDVLAIDPGLGWLYVAAESGDLRVFDLSRPGLIQIDAEHPGEASHSIAVDPVTHHVFLPLQQGPAGKPVLRIMRPSGV